MNEQVDRSKYKATQLNKLQAQEAEINKQLNLNGGGYDNSINFLSILEGENKIRIYPAHNSEDSYIYPKVVHFLPQKWTSKENNEEKEVIKKKPIFNSRIHGQTPKDIIEQYIALAEKHLKTLNDRQRAEEILKNMLDWKLGIKAQISWIVYATKIDGEKKEFGRLELTNGVKNKLNKLASIEGSDEPISVDPFTDPDEGVLIIIVYNPKAKDNKDKYSLKYSFKGKTLETSCLEDEEIEVFEKLPSLKTMYHNSYKRSDFLKALKGLELYDEDKKVGIFMLHEWDSIVEEISNYYPVEEDTNSEEDNNSEEEHEETSNNKSGIDQKKTEKEIDITDISIEDLIDSVENADFEYLKEINEKMELGLPLKASYQISILREMVKSELVEKLDEQDDNNEEKETETKKEPETTKKKSSLNLKDRMNKIKD